MVLQQDAPINDIGVTEILLLTMGTPNSAAISSAVLASFPAYLAILSWIFWHVLSTSESAQSSRLMPIVTVLTSRFSCWIIFWVSKASLILIIAMRIRFCASY